MLLSEPLEESVSGGGDRGEAAADFLEPIVDRIAMPRRIADALRRICAMLPRLAQGKGGRVLKNEVAHYAIDVLEMALESDGKSTDGIAKMREEASAFAPPVTLGAGRRAGRFEGTSAHAARLAFLRLVSVAGSGRRVAAPAAAVAVPLARDPRVEAAALAFRRHGAVRADRTGPLLTAVVVGHAGA